MRVKVPTWSDDGMLSVPMGDSLLRRAREWCPDRHPVVCVVCRGGGKP